MKVGFAFSLFNNDTAATLLHASKSKDNQINDEGALTTTWFVETVFRWFKLMSSRTTKLSLSHFDEQQYEETITFLKGMIDLFEKIEIGTKTKKVGGLFKRALLWQLPLCCMCRSCFWMTWGFPIPCWAASAPTLWKTCFQHWGQKILSQGGWNFRVLWRSPLYPCFCDQVRMEVTYSDADGCLLARISTGNANMT